MATTQDIHEDIEPWLAAAVHNELSADERAGFEQHLAGCAGCRRLFEEEQTMSNMMEQTFGAARPDLAFEQRIVSGFRRQAPARGSVTVFLAQLWRLRATQLIGAAALLLTLAQTGRWLTSEDGSLGNEELAVQAVSPEGSLSSLREKLAGGVSTRRAAHAPPVFADTPGPVARGGTMSAPPQSKNFADVRQSAPANAPSAPPPLQAFSAPPSSGGMSEQSVTSDRMAKPSMVQTPESSSENERPEFLEEKSDTRAVQNEPSRDGQQPTAPDANRKLVRYAQVELEIIKFDEAVVKITAFATEDGGYIATSSSEKQENGKLQGQIVAKVLPANLDRFLLKLRGLGELKNQTLGTEDVTKQYFDTDSRLNSARVMETRLIDILKTKSNKVADLLEVEKELGRVRASIEEMQGALKYMDAQVQFATVTISLAEKDLNTPAAFLLKRRARLALFSTDVEKTFAEVRSVIDGAKAQVSSSTLDRDSTGEATARLTLLIVPEEADAVIDRIKGMGRVQNYNEQTERVAQSGSGMAQEAKVERDKVELSITISRNEQEPALQTTSLNILTSQVSEKTARLKENAAKSGAEIRSSSFSRNPDGREVANVRLRVPMKNYAALMSSFDQLGQVKDVSVSREDRRGAVNEETAPADINIQVYSEGNIVGHETGLWVTFRNTLAQGAAALMWSLRMIGVALAFFAPWVLAIAVVVWLLRKLSRRRAAKRETTE